MTMMRKGPDAGFQTNSTLGRAMILVLAVGVGMGAMAIIQDQLEGRRLTEKMGLLAERAVTVHVKPKAPKTSSEVKEKRLKLKKIESSNEALEAVAKTEPKVETDVTLPKTKTVAIHQAAPVAKAKPKARAKAKPAPQKKSVMAMNAKRSSVKEYVPERYGDGIAYEDLSLPAQVVPKGKVALVEKTSRPASDWKELKNQGVVRDAYEDLEDVAYEDKIK